MLPNYCGETFQSLEGITPMFSTAPKLFNHIMLINWLQIQNTLGDFVIIEQQPVEINNVWFSMHLFSNQSKTVYIWNHSMIKYISKSNGIDACAKRFIYISYYMSYTKYWKWYKDSFQLLWARSLIKAYYYTLNL